MMKDMIELMPMKLDGASDVELIPNAHITKERCASIRSFLEDRGTMKNITFELPDDVICVSITSLSGDTSGMCFETRNYGEEKLIEGVIVPWEKDKANEF